jgi:quinol monooxygenase YgiN
MYTAATILVLAFLVPVHPLAQEPDKLSTDGMDQLRAARASRTDDAYRVAEETFSRVLTSSPNHAHALVYRGEARIMRGVLALPTSFDTASTFFDAGISDMDRAVSLAPTDLAVRVARGVTYAEFPDFYNKRAIARQDLEAAMTHPDYARLPEALRVRVERASKRTTDSAKDRLNQVPATVSPIMVVASVTLERVRPSERPVWMKDIVEALYRAPGLLGVHSATSFEQPGMYLIFSWWRNKQSVNDFYYGESHQSWIRQRGPHVPTTYFAPAPTQVAIELFAPLPDGVRAGGQFTPSGAVTR